MKSINVILREEMKKEIKEFLITGNYQHTFAILSDNSINTLKSIDLTQIYQILIKGISATPSINSKKETIIRPNCPITCPKKINQAKIEYKLTMIEYIKQFGIYLIENAPCNYTPAILEALANYCEKNMKSNNESVATQWEEIDK